MFFGRNAGLGLSNAKELSSFSNKQLRLTDRAVSSLARLAETKANKSAVLNDRASKGAWERGSKGSLDNPRNTVGSCADPSVV